MHGLAYLNKINEVWGYKISYDHRECIKHRNDLLMGMKIDFTHIFPLSIKKKKT